MVQNGAKYNRALKQWQLPPGSKPTARMGVQGADGEPDIKPLGQKKAALQKDAERKAKLEEGAEKKVQGVTYTPEGKPVGTKSNDDYSNLFDTLKTNSTIKLMGTSVMSSSAPSYREFRVGRATRQRDGSERRSLSIPGAPKSVKHYLYKDPDGKITYAMGDMYAELIDIQSQ